MANQEHLDILKQGVEVWNKWREDQRGFVYKSHLNEAFSNPLEFKRNMKRLRREISSVRTRSEISHLNRANFRRPSFNKVDLSMADLHWADLSMADLSMTDLSMADLSMTDLSMTDLSWADLKGANLREADLRMAKLWQVDLSDTDLTEADLREAKFTWANLNKAHLNLADLREADLINTDLTDTTLTGCRVFGISVWNVSLEGAVQKDLIITNDNELEITVDNLEVAQFIYLLLNNQKIRDVINTITSKVVLILGCFTGQRKPVLDALRDELRQYNYSPVVFDFKPSTKRDLTETISTLAHLSRFVIADLTDGKSIPQELETIIPHLPSVPVQPLLQIGTTEYVMFEHYERYPWVLPIYHYQDIPNLLASIKEHIIKPVEQEEQKREKTEELEEKVRILEQKVKELEKHK